MFWEAVYQIFWDRDRSVFRFMWKRPIITLVNIGALGGMAWCLVWGLETEFWAVTVFLTVTNTWFVARWYMSE